MIQAITVAACAALLLLPPDPPGYNHPDFGWTTDSSERFVVLERYGNTPDITGYICGPERKGYVTVLEYLGEGKPLRKLYEVELLNEYSPLLDMLSHDGRFYLTFGDSRIAGTGHGPSKAVVIYDLARKEHTAYAGKDFLGEKRIESLLPHMFAPGFKWFGKDFLFNQDATRFYPTLPSNCEREEVPFVVIDLPTRTVRVEPISNEDPQDIVPDGNSQWGWLESKETVKTDKTILPLRLRRTKWLSQPGTPDPDVPVQVYELAPDKTQYVPVKDEARTQQQKP
jgi:hypothetical protein